MSATENRAKKQLDRVIDNYVDDVGARTMEIMLQQRAQDMREIYSSRVDAEDIEGYNE